MAVGTLTLSDFLLARIAEDEATARAAVRPDPGPNYFYTPHPGWTAERRERGEGPPRWDVVSADTDEWGNHAEQIATTYLAYPFGAEQPIAEHIARHDPARVLAECAVKRQIVEAHDVTHECPQDGDTCGWWTDDPCDVLRLLASVYADHPDYDPEWRP